MSGLCVGDLGGRLRVDPKTLSPDVAVASDALIVPMRYQNAGYALLSF